MNRPILKKCVLSENPVKAKSQLTVTLEVEDEEIIFGTAYYYVSEPGEIYLNEEAGII